MKFSSTRILDLLKQLHYCTEALVVASKEMGLEINADKTKYMVMSQYQDAGQSHCIKVDNSYFERVEEFKHLGTKHIKTLFRKILRAD